MSVVVLCAVRALLTARFAVVCCALPQVAALTACCSFINSLEDNREREVFQPLLVPMLAALVRAGQQQQQQQQQGFRRSCRRLGSIWQRACW